MIKNFIFSGANITSPLANLGLLFTRVVVGLTMAYSHGLGKVPPKAGFVEGVRSMGLPAPELLAWLAGLAEFGGGLCIAVGLATRPASVMLFSTMFVAFFIFHGSDPFAKKEMALLYMTYAVLFFTVGAGKHSVDKLIRK